MAICCMNQGTQTGALWQVEGWAGEGDGRDIWEGGDMGVLMANSYLIENNKLL